MNFASNQPTRLLPIWKLILPTVVYGLSHYIISSLARYRVAVKMKSDILRAKGIREGDEGDLVEQSIYETYYPELVATFTGNLLADTLLYPLETILHRLYLQGTRTIIDNTDAGMEVVPIMTRYDGAIDCYSTILSEEGFSGLYKGFGGLVLQYALHVAVLKLTRLGFDLMSGADGGRTRPPVSVESLPPSRHHDAPPYESGRMSGGPRMRGEYSGPRGGDYGSRSPRMDYGMGRYSPKYM
jgi:solute carrier family 25 protein 46